MMSDDDDQEFDDQAHHLGHDLAGALLHHRHQPRQARGKEEPQHRA
jgi:hypothetical protein